MDVLRILVGVLAMMGPFLFLAYMLGRAVGRDGMLPIKRALAVMVLDARISAYLRENDPKAFEQAVRALDADNKKCV